MEQVVDIGCPELSLPPRVPRNQWALRDDLVQKQLQSLCHILAKTQVHVLGLGGASKNLEKLVADELVLGVVTGIVVCIVVGRNEESVRGGQRELLVDEAGHLAELAEGAAGDARVQGRDRLHVRIYLLHVLNIIKEELPDQSQLVRPLHEAIDLPLREVVLLEDSIVVAPLSEDGAVLVEAGVLVRLVRRLLEVRHSLLSHIDNAGLNGDPVIGVRMRMVEE